MAEAANVSNGRTAIDLRDYVDISNVLGSYALAFDTGDGEAWANLFTEDGVFESDGIPVVGREALAGLVRTLFSQTGGLMRHLSGSLHLAYGNSQDEAVARYYSHVSTWGPNASALLAECVVTLVRAKDGWLLRRNDCKLLTAGAPAEAL